MTDRRAFIAAAAGSIVAAVMARAAGNVHWSYEGAEGPEHWGELAEDFGTCSFGTQQSPVDLAGAVAADADDIALMWNPEADWEVVNNGHTIQANGTNAGSAEIAGKRYALLQFHFHAPSEHVIDGKRFAMEAHFVHRADDGALAVLGVMMQGGGDNALFDGVMAKAPHDHGAAAIGPADPTRLLPAGRQYFRYQGSLTTPPCSETVLWTVLRNPVTVPDQAIAAFTGIFPMNARPLQATNRRFILSE